MTEPSDTNNRTSSDDLTPSLARNAAISLLDGRPSYAVGHAIYTFVLTGADTAGAYASFDVFVPPGGRQPPQCHGYEKMLFVIKGELEVFFGQSRATLGPQAGINIPSWMPHMLRNVSKRPVRVLVTVSPAGLEGLFREIGQRVAARTSSPPTLSKDERERLDKLILASFRRHHARLLPEDMFDDLLNNSTS